MPIILGSESPYRKKALEELGYTVRVIPANIDEKAIRHHDPLMLTLLLARAKAEALIQYATMSTPVLTADTVGFLNDGTLLEKPSSTDELYTMIERYNQGEHVHFVTALHVTRAESRARSGVAVSTVRFDPIPHSLVEETIRTGEAFRCAGGFTLSNEKTWGYVSYLEGERDTVIGFPKTLASSLLS